MSQDHPVYDLGEIDLERTRADFPRLFDRTEADGLRPRAVDRGPGRGAASRPGGGGIGPALAGSLSMFVPGLGQVAAGEVAWGLFFATGVGFCASLLWAAAAMLDRLVPTLDLLGVPVQAFTVVLIAIALAAVFLHLAAVAHAFRAGKAGAEGIVPHPIVTAIASLLVPGWGQILAGHLRRAVLLLAATWLVALAWLLVTPAAGRMLLRIGLELPAGLREGWGPVALLAAPVVVWTMAVYDAAAGAAVERSRSLEFSR